MKFAVYSSSDNRPVIREWFDDEAEALVALAEIRAADIELSGRAEERYTVVELTEAEEAFHVAADF